MKRQRQAAILGIVSSEKVRNQSEIVEALRSRGFEVSQTTVSRDLNEIGLTRLRDGASARYVRPSEGPVAGDDAALRRAAPQVLLTTEATGNIVVVKTQPGGAQGLAWAIDAAELPGIAGTVGGDDTIMVVCSRSASSARISEALMGYALEQE
jgi:transcriptional regulator of arginine metabolism